jgi:predicted DNA-binding protein YlxM (UPF0122 family)
MDSGKRKHITLTLFEKMEIIELCERKETTKAAIAQMYGIGRSTVSDIFSNRASIKAFVSLHNDNDVTKRRKLDKFYHASSIVDENNQLRGSDEDETQLVDNIDEYEYHEIADQDYEVVLDGSMNQFSNSKKIQDNTAVDIDGAVIRTKRKSRTLTFREKYEIIQQIEAGVPVTTISQSYDVGKTTIYDFLKRKEEILAYIEKTNDLERRTFKGSRFPGIEERVLEWCESKETFTKEELFTIANNVFEDMKNSGQPVPKNGFCRSTWYKRFFSRNPQMKCKVVTATGEPEEFSKDNSFSDTRKIDRSNQLRILSYDEKLDILRQIEANRDFDEIAEEFNSTKNSIIDVYNKRDILKNVNIDRRKTLKSVVKFPTMELALLHWCLDEDKIYPINYDDISKQSEKIFSKLGLKGNFEPSVKWAKSFVMRHPQLRAKQGILVASETSNFAQDEIIEEDTDHMEMDNNSEYEYLEEIVEHDPEPEYEEEYIVEEIEPEENYVNIEPKTDRGDQKHIIELIPDSTALNNLKTLIQYTEQKGHIYILQHLLDYQSQLEEEGIL